MATGRNEPCPCGSGRKFKACCLPLGRRLLAEDSKRETTDLATRYRELLAISLAGGADALMAEVRAAVALAGTLCLAPSSPDDPELGPCLVAFAAALDLLEENGGGEENLVDTFLPRLPFDVVLDEEGRTAGDLILARHGAALPTAACEALRALVEAEDALCRVERAGGRVFVEDVRTGRKLPAVDAFRPEGPGLVCRLVSYRGRHVPLDPGLVDDPDDPWYEDDLEDAVETAAEFCTSLGFRLRSRAKGAGLGFELLDVDDAMESAVGLDGPEIRNTEGHELVFTTLRWDVTRELAAREALGKVAGLELQETPEGLTGTFVKAPPPKARRIPEETVTIGMLRLEGTTLTVEANSVERANRLRKKLDEALGGTATFRSVVSEPLEAENPDDPASMDFDSIRRERGLARPE